ncbi:hypothetical protein Bca4012_013403 [Brassica carinata]
MARQGHIFFDKETHAGKVFFYELISKYSGNNPAPSLLRGYAKVEPLSISELNQFLMTAKPQVYSKLAPPTAASVSSIIHLRDHHYTAASQSARQLRIAICHLKAVNWVFVHICSVFFHQLKDYTYVT